MIQEQKNQFVQTLNNMIVILSKSRIINPENLPYTQEELNLVIKGVQDLGNYVVAYKIEEPKVDVPVLGKV